MFNFLESELFWAIAACVLAVIPLIFWLIDRRDRNRLNSYYLKGKRFYAKQLKYSPVYFPGARVDKETKKASNYEHREIENKIKEYIEKGKSIVLLGSPLRGKTRTMIECLNKLKRTDCAIALPSAYDGEIKFPKKKWFCKKHILVMDDLQDFFDQPNNAVRLIDVAYQEGFIIVANCRSSGEWQAVQNAYDTISKRFDIIEIPAPTQNEVNGVLEKNNLKTVPGFYDGKNIGTLIIDLDTMRERYDKVKNSDKGKVLLCIKELYYLGIINDKREVEKSKIALIAKAHDLVLTTDELNKSIQWIIDNEFVTASNRGINPETVYLDRIVEPGYPLTEMIESGLRAFPKEQINFTGLIYSALDAADAWSVVDFMKTKNIPPALSEYNQLMAKQPSYQEASKVYEVLVSDQIVPDKQTFYTLINLHLKDYGNDELYLDPGRVIVFEKACETFHKASKNEQADPDLYAYWGLALDAMARTKGNDLDLFTQACDKYEQATEIKKDNHGAFYNWGIVLAAMAKAKGNDISLFSQAFDKYRQATEIKKDMYEAFYNWGIVLDGMARVKGNDLDLFSQACNKYHRAIEIKKDLHQAFHNWGVALAAMARTKGNDLDLLSQACTKYQQAIEIKKDLHEAFYNWGVALDDMARAKGNDEKLLGEAKEKRLIAHRLRPDLYDENGNIIQS